MTRTSHPHLIVKEVRNLIERLEGLTSTHNDLHDDNANFQNIQLRIIAENTERIALACEQIAEVITSIKIPHWLTGAVRDKTRRA